MTKKKPGLYANIHAKQERIAHGSGETMRKAGDEGAPTAKNFEKAAETEKPKAKTKPRKTVRKTTIGETGKAQASAKNVTATKTTPR